MLCSAFFKGAFVSPIIAQKMDESLKVDKFVKLAFRAIFIGQLLKKQLEYKRVLLCLILKI